MVVISAPRGDARAAVGEYGLPDDALEYRAVRRVAALAGDDMEQRAGRVLPLAVEVELEVGRCLVGAEAVEVECVGGRAVERIERVGWIGMACRHGQQGYERVAAEDFEGPTRCRDDTLEPAAVFGMTYFFAVVLRFADRRFLDPPGGALFVLCAVTAAYSVSGAISAPFGQATVSPSTKKRRKYAIFLSGSNTGPFNQGRKSIVRALSSSSVT